MCWKVPYETRREALSMKRNRAMRIAHAYRCQGCGSWHVTSMSRNTFKQSRRH